MNDNQQINELFKLFASIDSEKEANMIMTDLLTPQEIESLGERWQLIQELINKTPQREISKKLNISISKITRGSRALKYGTGGFQYFIDKLKSKKEGNE